MNRRFSILHIFLIAAIYLVSGSNLLAQEDDFSKMLWAADWSPDGTMIAVGGNNGALKIYSKKGFKLKKTFPFKGTITTIKWHPKENLLAVATQIAETKTRIINLDSEESIILDSIPDEGGARALDWNFDGRYLAIGDNGGDISIYTKSGNFIRKIKKGNTFSNTGLAWHPSKNVFVVVSKYINIFTIEGELQNRIKHRSDDVLLLCVEWHPSGDFFAIGDYGYENIPSLIQFWSKEGKLLKTMDHSNAEYRSIRWTEDGEKLATASDALRVWSKEGDLISEGKSSQLLWGLDWNKNEKCIITSSEKGTISIWNKNAKLKKQIK